MADATATLVNLRSEVTFMGVSFPSPRFRRGDTDGLDATPIEVHPLMRCSAPPLDTCRISTVGCSATSVHDLGASALVALRRYLGGYRVDALLGSGGMGEVFRAHDTRLGRDVAIKILTPAFANDPDRVARLEREARVLATLNHPNIGGIHGIEDTVAGRALVLELVEGETLAERLKRGPLPLAETAPSCARQIALALEAAHDKGIVHRDLKPANIQVTPAGVVKVLDFGLAKPLGEPAPGDPTVATGIVDATGVGTILGTAAYMSPEQARGRTVDSPTDVWAFGCVVYEMLSGRRAFGGETLVDTLAAIVEREPEWGRLPDEVPESVRPLLRRCLEKDSLQRLRDIGDARLELTAIGLPRNGDSQRSAPPRRGVRRSFWAAAAAAALVATGLLLWRFTASPPAVEEPPGPAHRLHRLGGHAVASHDGRMFTFIRGVDFGRTAPTQGRVYVKLLPAGDPVELTTGEGGGYPTFSPGRLAIVFTKVSERQLGFLGRPCPRWSAPAVPSERVGSVVAGASSDCVLLDQSPASTWASSRRLPTAATRRDLLPGQHRRHGAPVHALAGRPLVARGGNGAIRVAAVPVPPRRRILRGPVGGTATRTVHQRGLVHRWAMDVPSRRTPAVRSTSGGSRIPMARPSRSPSARRNRKAPPSPPTAVI